MGVVRELKTARTISNDVIKELLKSDRCVVMTLSESGDLEYYSRGLNLAELLIMFEQFKFNEMIDWEEEEG